MTTYSELARSRSGEIRTRRRATPAPISRARRRSQRARSTPGFPSPLRSLGRRADDALQQIIHLVEERVEIVVSLVDHHLAVLLSFSGPT